MMMFFYNGVMSLPVPSALWLEPYVVSKSTPTYRSNSTLTGMCSKYSNPVQTSVLSSTRGRPAVVVRACSDNEVGDNGLKALPDGREHVIPAYSALIPPKVAVDKSPVDPKLRVKLLSKLTLRKNRKIRKRKRKLRVKRKLRKKGRWPLAKLNKQRNQEPKRKPKKKTPLDTFAAWRAKGYDVV